MFQNNPLLAQLKKKLHSQIPRTEGIVKGTEKTFGFLEIDSQKSYFIPPAQMKKVMHGDRISAVIHIDKDRESVEPESLIEPFLTRFVGKIQKKDERLWIIPDHPLLRNAIHCRAISSVNHNFNTGDWAVAQMRQHPLKGDANFYAELTEFITTSNDYFAPWWVTLARHNLERDAPNSNFSEITDEKLNRIDLTHLSFITIDNASTEDMDDALYITETKDENFYLKIAIADPTAYVEEGSELDKLAEKRAFTSYLPGFNIPMLPRKLSDYICSLRPYHRRPAIVCCVKILKDGSLTEDMKFYTAWIESKAKLIYDEVSDCIEKYDYSKISSQAIQEQILLLHRFCIARMTWRKNNAIIFKDRPYYRFILGEKGDVLNVVLEKRRIAHRIIEEAMILANICAAKLLKKHLGFGIYNLHTGFDLTNAEQVSHLLSNYGIIIEPKTITTLEGFRQLRRKLDEKKCQYLDMRIRRFQSPTEISIEPGPHFGLGVHAYATWTSPIRKFGDMINHRLIKAILRGEVKITRPKHELILTIVERRRLNRIAERDLNDWLYANFLAKFVGKNYIFSAEIIDISRGGMRIRLQENGAIAFIPASFIHSVRDEIISSHELGTLTIKGELIYRITDIIHVNIIEVRMETRSVIARIVK